MGRIYFLAWTLGTTVSENADTNHLSQLFWPGFRKVSQGVVHFAFQQLHLHKQGFVIQLLEFTQQYWPCTQKFLFYIVCKTGVLLQSVKTKLLHLNFNNPSAFATVLTALGNNLNSWLPCPTLTCWPSVNKKKGQLINPFSDVLVTVPGTETQTIMFKELYIHQHWWKWKNCVWPNKTTTTKKPTKNKLVSTNFDTSTFCLQLGIRWALCKIIYPEWI